MTLRVLLLLLACPLLLAACASGEGGGGRMSVEELAEALDQGRIRGGDQPNPAHLPKEFAGVGVGEEPDRFSEGVYSDDYIIVTLYSRDGRLFAASTHRRIGWQRNVVWHFFDPQLFAEHVRKLRAQTPQ